MRNLLVAAIVFAVASPGIGLAQSRPPATPPPAQNEKVPAPVKAVVPAVNVPTDADFRIGPDDVLGILFWRDADMSGDVTVRPDGMISLPLVRDIRAAGLTPTQLADNIQQAVREFVTDASVTVVVRQMNSRKVFITGEVAKPGAYALGASMNVMQLIALAGGLTEFADGKNIVITRAELGSAGGAGGQKVALKFNYKEVSARKNLYQNVDLRPGDTVIVPEK